MISCGARSGDRLRSALNQLDLFVSLDLYHNETNRHAHYILPTATMYEREDFPLLNQGAFLRPGLWASRALVQIRDRARTDWHILWYLAGCRGIDAAFLESAAGRAECGRKWRVKL